MRINPNNKYLKNWKQLLWISSLVTVLFIGTRCSCNYHMRRVHAKCPSSVVQDTILVHDTLRIPEVKVDTIFHASKGDTVYIDTGRLHIRYINLGEGRHNIAGKCDTVFIPRFIKVPYTKTVYRFDWWHFVRSNILWLLLILVAIWITIQYFRLTR